MRVLLGCEVFLHLEPTVSQPFSLRIFVADGDPDGLRIVDKSNWIGRRWYSRARCCRRSRPGPS